MPDALHYVVVDVFANAPEIQIDSIIGYSKHGYSPSFDLLCANSILDLDFLFIMLRAIQLNHQPGSMAIKICNIGVYDFLSQKSHRIVS